MKTLRISLLILSILALIIIVFAGYTGLFTKMSIVEKEEGGYLVVGKDFVGSYNLVGQPMSSADSVMHSLGIITDKGFGIYYDDPKITPGKKCRSFVGNIVNTVDSSQLEAIKAKGLRVDTIKKALAMVIEFPIISKFSYMVGPMKAYPAFAEYAKKKALRPCQSVELYDRSKNKIVYIMQYSN